MKKTTLALGMHDKLFKRARTMYQIEHRICDLLMTKASGTLSPKRKGNCSKTLSY